jgi:hypothetical protein
MNWRKTEEETILLGWLELRVHRGEEAWLMTTSPAIWDCPTRMVDANPSATIGEAKALALQWVAAAVLELSDAIHRAGVPMSGGER